MVGDAYDHPRRFIATLNTHLRLQEHLAHGNEKALQRIHQILACVVRDPAIGTILLTSCGHISVRDGSMALRELVTLLDSVNTKMAEHLDVVEFPPVAWMEILDAPLLHGRVRGIMEPCLLTPWPGPIGLESTVHTHFANVKNPAEAMGRFLLSSQHPPLRVRR